MAKRSKSLPDRPNLEQYRKQAKDLVKAHQAGDPDAVGRITRALPRRNTTRALGLTEAQRVIAAEHGFPSWLRFKDRIIATRGSSAPQKGDAVVVTAGPFTGLLGLVSETVPNSPDLVVSLEIHSRSTRVWLHPRHLSRA